MKKLMRTSKDKRILGVCGGIASYFSIQSAIFRLFCLFTGIAFLIVTKGGPGIFILGGLYMTLAYIMPSDAPKTEKKNSKVKLRNLMLYKLKEERMICGACAGIGDMLNIDPTLIRVSVIIPTLFTGIIPGVIIYVLYSWIVPEKEDLSFNVEKKEADEVQTQTTVTPEPATQS